VDVRIRPSRLGGSVAIPGSKSHTIRAVAVASLAEGTSVIHAPLESNDTRAAFNAYTAAGAHIETAPEAWRITGVGGRVNAPRETVDVLNSGTTLHFAMGSFALLREGRVVLTGDAQIQRRPAGPLAASLRDLGAKVRSVRDNGCAPFEVEGRMRGGRTTIDGKTSQWLSSLLVNTPLADGDTQISVPYLNEAPYAHMTLWWLARQGIKVEYAPDLSSVSVRGGQTYRAFDMRIPADFSSATFFLGAGALGGNEVTSTGLDMTDTQGDKAVVEYLQRMGARVTVAENGVTVEAAQLRGAELDLNATPDALPMMAVVGCLAEGRTVLGNVPQARIKETDRIAVMREELGKMGARVTELADGLVVEESALRGAVVDGHDDHRVVMALAVAATAARGETVIRGAEAAAVTFPSFFELMTSLGADIARE
jgi:3-phosphoshikimate 1-carboxyvinyltransferase